MVGDSWRCVEKNFLVDICRFYVNLFREEKPNLHCNSAFCLFDFKWKAIIGHGQKVRAHSTSFTQSRPPWNLPIILKPNLHAN